MHNDRIHLRHSSICWRILPGLAVLLWSLPANAQTATWRLHSEASAINSFYRQLKEAGPDVAATTIQSVDLKKLSPNQDVSVATFQSQVGAATAGVIPTGSTVTFTLWMRKTAAQGVLRSSVAIFRTDPDLPSAIICGAGGGYSSSPALTTTLDSHTLSCTTTAPKTLTTSDRLVARVYVYIDTTSTKTVKAELGIEGVATGNYDSRLTLPALTAPPSLTSVTPTAGPIGTAIQVAGANLGAAQGTSTVTLGGLGLTPTSWTASSIQAPIPPGAMSGPIVVTVGGAASNELAFAVSPPPTLSNLSPASGGIATAVTIQGNNFATTQGNSTVTFAGVSGAPSVWSNTSITVAVPSGAVSGPVVVTVGGRGSRECPVAC